jgi:DNA polymerase-3 subunit delta'
MSGNDLRAADRMPWLSGAQAQLRAARERERLPHALLVHAMPGLGAEVLAAWIAAFVLCERVERAPCGECAACRLLRAGNHPDLTWVGRAEESKQIQVDQVRALTDTFALKSLRGGAKVAAIAPADAMNVNAANALLKTLEEPPPRSLLILCAARPARLPATIVSRCLRVSVRAPARAAALEWLQAVRPRDDWAEILEFAAGAPLRALELEGEGIAELTREMTAALEQLQARTLDIPAVAERWARSELATRVNWFETWITNSLRAALTAPVHLQSTVIIRNIRGLYALLDQVRALKMELDTSLNMQLATENLLFSAEAALAA